MHTLQELEPWGYVLVLIAVLFVAVLSTTLPTLSLAPPVVVFFASQELARAKQARGRLSVVNLGDRAITEDKALRNRPFAGMWSACLHVVVLRTPDPPVQTCIPVRRQEL